MGVANIVFGSGTEVGTELIEHPDVRVISFTGSTETGRHVAEIGGRHLKKVSLEMGGKNAVIVMDDADLDLAVEGIFGVHSEQLVSAARHVVVSSCIKM